MGLPHRGHNCRRTGEPVLWELNRLNNFAVITTYTGQGRIYSSTGITLQPKLHQKNERCNDNGLYSLFKRFYLSQQSLHTLLSYNLRQPSKTTASQNCGYQAFTKEKWTGPTPGPKIYYLFSENWIC